MTRAEFRRWFDDRIETQIRLTLGSMAGMAGIGMLALLLQAGILFLILKLTLGGILAFLVTAAVSGGLSAAVMLTAPAKMADSVHSAEIDGEESAIRIAQPLASAWTFAMGTLETDQSIPERILGLAMLAPRMFWTAWFLYQRNERLRVVDTKKCAPVLRLLFRKAERVEPQKIADKCGSEGLAETLGELSLVDGVVFLTKHDFGLTIAPRLTDAFNKYVDSLPNDSDPG